MNPLVQLLAGFMGKGETEKPSLPPANSILPLGGSDHLTKDQLFEGVHIFGATGSGKTSGSGQALAVRLLQAGFGGLVLTAKPHELSTWRSYMQAAGRPAEDLLVLEPGGGFAFNFLEYERTVAADLLARGKSKQRHLTDNLVALFCVVMEVAQRGSSQGGQDAYWLQTLRQLLRNAIDLLSVAGEEISYQNLYDLIISAPGSRSLVAGLDDESKNWQKESFCYGCVTKAAVALSEASGGAADGHPDYPLLRLATNYWLKEFPALAQETRSVIVSYFTSVADAFLRGILCELFSSSSQPEVEQLTPEASHNGKVILINLPLKEFGEAGQFAQVLYKFVWQRSTERRNVNAPGQAPVFLWADEAQFFVNSHDMLFQTTARSRRAATVYLTQNISNYYAMMPGDKGRAETDSLLGNFQTKIFHANGDSVTNRWAAELIGQDWTFRQNRSSSVSNRGDMNSGAQFGSSANQMLAYQVMPIQFTTLKKGGAENEFRVEAFIFQGGRRWSNGNNYKGLVFSQETLPPGPDEAPENS